MALPRNIPKQCGDLAPTLVRIHPGTILENCCLGINVYIKDREGAHPIKFISNEQVVDALSYTTVRSNPELQVFIDDSSLGVYRDFLNQKYDIWIRDPLIEPEKKTALLLDSLKVQWEREWGTTEASALVATARDIAKKVACYSASVPLQIPSVTASVSEDAGLMRHSFRTGIYAAILACELGFDVESQVNICAGGMLHDIGKRDWSDEADHGHDNPDRRLRAHPTIGFRRLCHLADLPEDILMMCYQHHETMVGDGYPVGLTADEIYESSRICAIVNRFDHLTSSSGSRSANSFAAAGRILELSNNSQYDQEMMQKWLKTLKRHLKQSSNRYR